ncbi:DUF4194 domain-containing protein [Salinispira pacifica]|nr:DUF4194 domain-containing protein [Salinispira pacifica]
MDETNSELSDVLITLLKGTWILRHGDQKQQRLWAILKKRLKAVSNHLELLRLKLIVDEVEGFAHLRGMDIEEGGEGPRLTMRTQLPYRVSYLLVMLRKMLDEYDASDGSHRCVVSTEVIFDRIRLANKDGTNKARMKDEFSADLKKVKDMGFISPIPGDKERVEISRVIKAYVDAALVSSMAEQLEIYAEYANKRYGDSEGAPSE